MTKVKVVRRVVKRRRQQGEIVRPASRAIRCFCLECMGYNAAEVARCTATECHLWPYRMGGGKKVETMAEKG